MSVQRISYILTWIFKKKKKKKSFYGLNWGFNFVTKKYRMNSLYSVIGYLSGQIASEAKCTVPDN